MSKDKFNLRQPGVIHTISGNSVDLRNFTADQISIYDIAWGLGRILRYNGHIRQDHTVAHHSIVMSYYVPEPHALEALLHDAAEAYIGDMIWPVKAMFPLLEEFENSLMTTIMDTFEVPIATTKARTGEYLYVKSAAVAEADIKLLEHECNDFKREGGVFHQDVEDAWLHAARTHEQYWYAPQYAFIQRFRELDGFTNPHELDLKELTKIWFYEEWLADQETERARKEMDKELAAMELLK